ncbi:MAG: tRNA dihydrouridine synthase DusB [Deltaproteobacteria bacterium]|nr:tRNA dihydrouridine synthase DusB [Deltaproteobacteria bacterium]
MAELYPKGDAVQSSPLRLGPLRVDPPVILAPMAGVTNWPFRRLCRGFGAGLYVSEMVTARPLAEGRERTLALAEFGEDESPRSLQLYGVDPHFVGRAVERLVGEGRIDHLDLNFGCPVRKVTRKGGGAALPARPKLLRRIVHAAVEAAGDVPVTIKFRTGIDDQLITYPESGRIAEGEGCAAVTLHARTAAQLYDGHADWDAIAHLKSLVSIPVIGNGDIWEAEDALRMLRETGCDAVAVGRGCLGRPWLFRDLADAFAGRSLSPAPNLGEVAAIMLEHARLLSEWLGEGRAMRDFRRHATWYTKGFRGSAALRKTLMRVTTLAELREILGEVNADEPFPEHSMRVPRGKTSGRQKVTLPEGFLDDDGPLPEDAGLAVSGG